MNMTASLFFALTLVGGSIDPGAPIESPSGVTIAATFILPEPTPPPGSNQDSTEFSTTPISAVLPGAVILREPFLDIDPKETFSIWSDVVIFRSDDQGNFFADLY